MRIKYKQLTKESIESIDKLIEQEINTDQAMVLVKIVKELATLIEDRVRLESGILHKWVQRDSEGNPIVAKDDFGDPVEGYFLVSNMELFNEEMAAMLNLEIDIHFDKIKLVDLGLEKIKLKDLIHIDYLFE